MGFVFQRDSHLKAVQATALRMSAQFPDAQIRFYGIDSNPNLRQDANALDISINSLEQLSDCDYLICCLGGYLLNKVIKQYQNSETKVIALFPGVVSHFQLDAFISRFNADQVWLNCPADFELYAKLCQVFGVCNNGVLYGAAWFLEPDHKVTNDGATIFFEQTQIISDTQTSRQIELQIIDIIQKNLDKPFIYKLRQNIHNEFLVKIRERLASFANVQMVSVLSDEMLASADVFLSISSSAIVEGLLLDKQCFLLDRQYLDIDGLEFFDGSNIFLNQSTGKINRRWLDDRVCLPKKWLDIQQIEKKQIFAQFPKRNLWQISLWLIQVMCYYPKLWRVVVLKGRFYAIQKSLEYVRVYDKSNIRD